MAAVALTDVPRSSEEWRAFLQRRVAGFGRTLASFVLGFYVLTIVEVCSHHLHTVPEPPSQRAEGVPRDLENVVLRCLAKSASERYADARELEDALLACDARPKIEQRPSETPPGAVEVDLVARPAGAAS